MDGEWPEPQSPPFHFRPIGAPPGTANMNQWEPEHNPPEQGFAGAVHSVGRGNAPFGARPAFPEHQAGMYYGQQGVRISISPMYPQEYQFNFASEMAPPLQTPPQREIRPPFFAPASESLSGNPFGTAGDLDGERSDARFAMFVYKADPPPRPRAHCTCTSQRASCHLIVWGLRRCKSVALLPSMTGKPAPSAMRGRKPAAGIRACTQQRRARSALRFPRPLIVCAGPDVRPDVT